MYNGETCGFARRCDCVRFVQTTQTPVCKYFFEELKAASSDEEIDTALDSILNMVEELECGHADAAVRCAAPARTTVLTRKSRRKLRVKSVTVCTRRFN